MSKCSKKGTLTVMTSIFACASFSCLCIAISTDYWLHATERIVPDQTQTTNVTYKKTSSGLWRKCVEFGHETISDTNKMMKMFNFSCDYISYFQEVEKDKNELGPTNTILLSLRKSTVFPVFSLLLLLAGEISCMLSHCDRKKKVLTFVSGILFVVAGLFTLIGLILYIGAITEEAGNKSKSTDQPRFEYFYGASFVLTVMSFTTAELTGVLSVYLYISRHKHSYREKVERLQSSTCLQAAAAAAAAGGGAGVDGSSPSSYAATDRSHPHQYLQQQQQQAFPNNIHAHLNSRPNGRPASAMAGGMNNGSPSMVGVAGYVAEAAAMGNRCPAAGGGGSDTSFYTFTPMVGARSRCDVSSSRETLASCCDGGGIGGIVREPSRYTLCLAGAVEMRSTPNHRYTVETSYRRTTPV